MELLEAMKKHGAEVTKFINGDMVKYVIENKELKYRKFIYINEARYEPDARVWDLFVAYMYDHGIRTSKSL